MLFTIFNNRKLCYYERGDTLELFTYNFTNAKRKEENIPNQDLSSAPDLDFDDSEFKTEDPINHHNSADPNQDFTASDVKQDNNGGPIIGDLDGLYTYGQLAKMLNKPENNLRYLINTFRDYIHPVAVSTNASAKRANFKYSENDYITLKSIISCKDQGMSNTEIMNLLKDGLLPDTQNQERNDEDELIDIIAKRILALYKRNLSARDQEVINQFSLVAGRNQNSIDNLIQNINNVFLEQKEYYESELSESKKQTDMLMEQNKQLQEQLSNAATALSDTKDAYDRNIQLINDTQNIIQKQAEYIEKLKDDLSRNDEQPEEKKGFFSRLFGL